MPGAGKTVTPLKLLTVYPGNHPAPGKRHGTRLAESSNATF